MGGRRKRTSDSTNGTVEHESHTYANELSVLKKFDNDLPDADLLQTFVLEDASIYDKTGRPVELFTVRTKGPFTVRGRVIIDGEQKQRAKNPTTKSAFIETKSSKRYAIGSIKNNGFVTYGAWAEGECGWYEIRPVASYKPMFDRMIEGVSIYYIMLEEIEKHEQKVNIGRKKGKKLPPNDLTIEALFFKYAVAVGDGATYDEVVDRCDEHAPFLISHFYEDEQQDFDWTRAIFFKWIVDRHPDIHASVLESRKKQRNAHLKNEIPEETKLIDAPVATDEPPAQKALSKRRPRSTQDASLAIDDIETHDFSSVAQRNERSRSRAKTKTQSQSPLPATTSAVQPPEPMDVDTALLVLPQRPAKDQAPSDRSNLDLLLEALEDLRTDLGPLEKNSLSKTSSKLYYKYTIKNYKASAEILEYYAKELLEHLDEKAWGGSKFWQQMQQSAAKSRAQLEYVTLEQIPANLIRRKTKTSRVELEETRSMAAVATPPPKLIGRPAGKMSALRLVGSKSSKRRFDSVDDTPDTISRGLKVAKYSHADDSEEVEEVDDDAPSPGEDDEDSDLDTSDSPSALKVVVRAETLPTTDAKGPNGTWVCDEEGCGFVVRDPEQDEGRRVVQAHIQEAHYEDDNRDARIDLAMTEGVKNHLPIDHLLEKIRQMGQRVLENEEISVDEVPVPQPIKRRLIS